MINDRRDIQDAPPGFPARTVLTTGPEAPAQARAHTRAVLAHDDLLDDALLIVSELVTNAYRYGTEPGDSVLVALFTTPDHVRIEVHDPRRRRPRMRKESGERARGRGLHIVDALAARWGTDDRPFGKVVWAELRR